MDEPEAGCGGHRCEPLGPPQEGLAAQLLGEWAAVSPQPTITLPVWPELPGHPHAWSPSDTHIPGLPEVPGAL